MSLLFFISNYFDFFSLKSLVGKRKCLYICTRLGKQVDV